MLAPRLEALTCLTLEEQALKASRNYVYANYIPITRHKDRLVNIHHVRVPSAYYLTKV